MAAHLQVSRVKARDESPSLVLWGSDQVSCSDSSPLADSSGLPRGDLGQQPDGAAPKSHMSRVIACAMVRATRLCGVTIMQFELLTLVIGAFFVVSYGFWMVTRIPADRAAMSHR